MCKREEEGVFNGYVIVDICTVLCVYQMNVVLEQKIVDRETVQMVSIVDTILDSI